MIALTGAGKLHIVGLIVAAAGILTLFATGVAKQVFPVGVVLLIAVVLLILFGPWRWTPILGVVLPLFIFITALIVPGLFDRLTNPAQTGAFVGTTVQMLGLITAIIFGSIASLQNYRKRSNPGGTYTVPKNVDTGRD